MTRYCFPPWWNKTFVYHCNSYQCLNNISECQYLHLHGCDLCWCSLQFIGISDLSTPKTPEFLLLLSSTRKQRKLGCRTRIHIVITVSILPPPPHWLFVPAATNAFPGTLCPGTSNFCWSRLIAPDPQTDKNSSTNFSGIESTRMVKYPLHLSM